MNVLALIVLAAIAIGMAAWAVIERGRAVRAETKLAEREAQAKASVEVIKNQAAVTANAVAEELVKRATESFRAQDVLAQARLEAQLKPVAETLTKFEAQVTAAEKARAEESGGLKAQITQLLAASTATQEEARKLSNALRRGAGVQGRWGEQILRNVLEMAGMRPGQDFEEQLHIAGDGAAARPDVVVRLAGEGRFVIDAKCSLNAYLEAQDAAEDAVREAAYLRHAQSVRAHMQSLSAKAYWDRLELSPDFVVMFVPGDAFLAAAVERLPNLYAEAMEQRVIVATPSSLFALCKAVVYGWRVEQQHVNAKEIAELGRELYRRLATMGDHAQDVGRALANAVGKYNQFVGSLETKVLVQARRFEDLKVDHEGKEIAELAPVEAAVRPLVKLAPAETPALTLAEAAPTSLP
jgi:DNA recombination protein RmuC